MIEPEHYAKESPHDLLELPEYKNCFLYCDRNGPLRWRLVYSGRMMIEEMMINDPDMDPWTAEEEVDLLRKQYDRLGIPGSPIILYDYADEELQKSA